MIEQLRDAEVESAERTRCPRRGTVLAFDYGEKRLGVAVGELELSLAHPLETIAAADPVRCDAAIARLVREWGPVMFVVGLPRSMDGRDSEIVRRCEEFARKLAAQFALPVEMVDEYLTSQAARMALEQAGVRGLRQKAMRDQVAAQQILQAYFEQKE
ncbi:MAG TPA: Holliday junction resolvase RuvX [Burkholderiales bacterium]|nr:Holliday junction resolvase RuvX [Burkholderiales bacterium]